MSFGTAQQAGDGYASKLYTGVENFKVVGVCPNHEQLKQIYGDNAKEDTYVLTSQEGEPQLKIVMYLDNQAEESEDEIKTKMTFFVTKKVRKTNDGLKTQYINAYGKTAWIPDGTKLPENGTYDIVGENGTYAFETKNARPALSGEENLIGMLRNLLNLPSLPKAEKPEDSESYFSIEDWNVMFSGNFNTLREVILNSPNKIGVLLGVKTVDDGKMYQDVFNRHTLRQWSKESRKFDYLRKDVVNTKQNGGYPNTEFGAPDYVLREYAADATPTAKAAIPEPASTGSFFDDDGGF